MKRSQIALLAMGALLAGTVVASVLSTRIALSRDRPVAFDGAALSRESVNCCGPGAVAYESSRVRSKSMGATLASNSRARR